MVVTMFSQKAGNKDPWPQSSSFKGSLLSALSNALGFPNGFPSEREVLWLLRIRKKMHGQVQGYIIEASLVIGSALLILHQKRI